MDKCVRMLKPGGKIAVFWTNQKKDIDIFKMLGTTADQAQVGLWASDKGILFRSFDLTENHRRFWIHAASEYEALSERLAAEIPSYTKKYPLSAPIFPNSVKRATTAGFSGGCFCLKKRPRARAFRQYSVYSAVIRPRYFALR